MSVATQSILISAIAARRHPGIDVAKELTPLADVPVVTAVEAGDNWSLLENDPLSPELVGLFCHELKTPCANLFRRSVVPNGYYVVREAESAGSISRIARELKLALIQQGFDKEAGEMNKLAIVLAELRGSLEIRAISDVFQWDAKHWALAVLGGLGLGTFVFGFCTQLGHDLYAITKPAVLKGCKGIGEKISKLGRDKDDPPPPPAPGGNSVAAGMTVDVPVELADSGEGDPQSSFVSVDEMAVAAQIAAGLAAAGVAQVITAPVTAPATTLTRGAQALRASLLLPRTAPIF